MSALTAGLVGMTLPAQAFAELSAGYGDENAARLLQRGQRSRRFGLLHEIASLYGVSQPWVALLAAASHRNAAAAEQVLAHPFVESWAAVCLNHGEDVEYFGGLAAAAALRAGQPFELSLPARQGRLTLPTIGTVVNVGAPEITIAGEEDCLVLLISGCRIEIARPFTTELPHWRPLPTVEVGKVALSIEDTDPHRDCFGLAASTLLAPDMLRLFAERIKLAWAILEADHKVHLRSMVEALRVIVPLSESDDGRPMSSSARGAYGAVAVSVSMSPEALALQILHEYMHMKLWALLDLVPMHGHGGQARHLAPWRSDPRTVPALLQGAYAHLGVTDFWRVRRYSLARSERTEAELQFAFWRQQTMLSVQTLLESKELTPHGARFVRGLGLTLQGWSGEQIPDDVRLAANDLVTIAIITWRLRNSRPRPAYTSILVRRYRRGLPPPKRLEPLSVTPTAAAGWQPSTLDLLIRDKLQERTGEVAVPAHSAYVGGDYAGARLLYRRMLRRDPGRTDAWCGLALALSRLGETAAQKSVTARPDLVRAVTLASRCDPVAVAMWLGQIGSLK